MASSPITAWLWWGNNGNSIRLLFSWAPKSLQMVTAAMKLKALDPWMERYHQHRQHIKKQRYHFVNKVHLFKAIVFPAVTYGCDSWTIKKAEHQIMDAFELWHWRRLLRVPWTSRRSNHSILKEISHNIHWNWTHWCWIWSSNTLATWCEELTH